MVMPILPVSTIYIRSLGSLISNTRSPLKYASSCISSTTTRKSSVATSEKIGVRFNMTMRSKKSAMPCLSPCGRCFERVLRALFEPIVYMIGAPSQCIFRRLESRRFRHDFNDRRAIARNDQQLTELGAERAVRDIAERLACARDLPL